MPCHGCWPLTMVISGGQTGADQAGLRAAKALHYRTGGMMPLGWKTEEGPRPEFQDLYGMTESKFAGYEHRTRHNIRASGGTVIFARGGGLDGGSALTESCCKAFRKPHCTLLMSSLTIIEATAELRLFIEREQIRILNVAGNRESKSPGIGMLVETFLLEALQR